MTKISRKHLNYTSNIITSIRFCDKGCRIYENANVAKSAKETEMQKTILNVGYCETTSEWLNRIITELADENKNFVVFIGLL